MIFKFKTFDRRFGGEIDSGTIEARNKTEARKLILKATRDNHDVPRANARDYGYVPVRDWHITFEQVSA